MIQNGTATSCPFASTSILAYIKKKLKEKYKQKKPLRTFHAKTIGLVKAKLIVNKGLDKDLKVGLFAEPKIYSACIRFTNGSSDPGDDIKKSVRGMAIKVLNDKKTIQNIVLSTSPIFFSGDAEVQLDGVKLILGNAFERITSLAPIIARDAGGALAFFKTNIVTPNILEEMYYSGTPYSFGNRVIKWHVMPLKTITTVLPKEPGPDFLREQLIKDLSEEAKERIYFALCVQFQENKKTEPIEDLTVAWKTPFHQVATIFIPKQKFDTHDIRSRDKDMDFSPAAFLPQHEPLGEVNKIRMNLYGALANDRRSYPS